MKRLVVRTALVAAAVVSAAVSAPCAEKSGSRETTLSDRPAAKPALSAGMTAEAVVKAVGRPLTIQPMKAPEGQAEVWFYRRVLERQSRQVQTGVRQVQGFVGGLSSSGLGMIDEPVWGMEHRTTYQLTRLLMVDGRLVNSTQSREVTTTYDK